MRAGRRRLRAGRCPNARPAAAVRRADVLHLHRLPDPQRLARPARPHPRLDLAVAAVRGAQARGRVRAGRRQGQLPAALPRGDRRARGGRRCGHRRRGHARPADRRAAAVLFPPAAGKVFPLRYAARRRVHLGRAAQPDRQIPSCRVLRRYPVRLLFAE